MLRLLKARLSAVLSGGCLNCLTVHDNVIGLRVTRRSFRWAGLFLIQLDRDLGGRRGHDSLNPPVTITNVPAPRQECRAHGIVASHNTHVTIQAFGNILEAPE
jgi:hypothetical protein